MRSNGVIGYVEDMTARKVNDNLDEDVLEEISSDDDDDKEDVHSPIKPADLEEVSSPEHDFNDDDEEATDSPKSLHQSEPVTQVSNNDKELEDIHSEEDEVSLSESEPEVELPELPIPMAPSKSIQNTSQEFEEIHSEEEIEDTAPNIEKVDLETRIQLPKPVMNNQEALEAVSSPESKSSASDVDLAFVERVELIYD